MFVRRRMSGIIQIDTAADGKGWSLVTIRWFLGPLGPLEQSLSVRPSVELNENTNNTCIPTTALYSIILYSTIWYSTVLYGTVLCCMVQYSTAY